MWSNVHNMLTYLHIIFCVDFHLDIQWIVLFIPGARYTFRPNAHWNRVYISHFRIGKVLRILLIEGIHNHTLWIPFSHWIQFQYRPIHRSISLHAVQLSPGIVLDNFMQIHEECELKRVVRYIFCCMSYHRRISLWSMKYRNWNCGKSLYALFEAGIDII